MEFTLNSKLGALLDNPQAKAIMEKYAPGISTHPMISMAKGFSLNSLLAMPQVAQAGLTKEKAEKLLDEINQAIE